MGRLEEDCFPGTCIPKPRSKAARYGFASLADEELVAILLNTGNRQENVVSLSSRLLEEQGGLKGLFLMDFPIETKGVREAKSFRILAVREIMRRMPFSGKVTIMDEVDAFNLTKNYYLGNRKEIAVVMFLDRDKGLIEKKVFEAGNGSEVYVPIAEIVMEGMKNSAVFVLMVHNHPSGSLLPSKEDMRFCQELEFRLRANGMVLLDFLVVDEKRSFSLRKNHYGDFWD